MKIINNDNIVLHIGSEKPLEDKSGQYIIHGPITAHLMVSMKHPHEKSTLTIN